MTFTPTSEQTAIISAATDTTENILVAALAGAAKTSTLVMIANALPKVNTICLAFNKKIANEMQDKLPPNCKAQTLNALGLAVWGNTIGKRCKTYGGKNYGILKDLFAKLPKDEQSDAWLSLGVLRKAMETAKSGGHIPDDFHDNQSRKCNRLLGDADLWNALETEPADWEWRIIIEALNISAKQSFDGLLDFGDQLLFPSVYKSVYPIHSLILIDEAQDLSELNHLMLAQLYRKRIIAVGDQCQAIYGFRGAFSEGMAEMKVRFSMREFPLSISFRCPTQVVNHVLWRAPHMKSWEGAGEGSVNRLATWDFTVLPETCTIICRNNAPLLSMAVRLLAGGRYPKLWGNDIAAGLIKTLNSFGPKNMAATSLMYSIADYEEQQLKKARNPRTIRDKCECLRILARGGDDLGGVIEHANQVFNSSGQIDLCTGHKAKGVEFRDVFFLDEHLIHHEGQEPNLRYVICTRAQENLTYITTEGCSEQATVEEAA